MVKGTTLKVETKNVSIDYLEKTTGFPKEFIKSELLIDEENISVDDLRLNLLAYLEKANLGQVELSK